MQNTGLDWIRERRVAAGLTQTQLAEAASMSRDLIARIEGGVHRNPTITTLQRIANALALAEQERCSKGGDDEPQGDDRAVARADGAAA